MAVFQGVIDFTGGPPIAAEGAFTVVSVAPIAIGPLVCAHYQIDFATDVSKAFVLATSFSPEIRMTPIPVSYGRRGPANIIDFIVGDKRYGLSFRVETSRPARRTKARKPAPAKRKKK